MVVTLFRKKKNIFFGDGTSSNDGFPEGMLSWFVQYSVEPDLITG